MLIQLLKNSFSLILAGIVDKIAFIVFIAVLARRLTTAEFGSLNLMFAMIAIGGLLSNFGIDYVVIREIAKDKSKARSIFTSAAVATLLFSIVAWPLTVFIASQMNYPEIVVTFLSYGGCALLITGIGQTASAVLKAFERMEVFAFINLIRSLVILVLGLLSLTLCDNLMIIMIVLLIIEMSTAAIIGLLVHRRFAAFSFPVDWRLIFSVVKMAFPFALLMSLGFFIHKIDLLLMGWLASIDDVAQYGAASKFTEFLSVFSAGLVGAIYPAISSRINSRNDAGWTLFNDSVSIFAILGFGAAFSLTVLAEPVILFIFGKVYLPATMAVVILAWSFLFTVLSGPAGTLILAAGKRLYLLVLASVILVGINIVLNMILIKRYTYNGAALAVILTSFMGFIIRMILVNSHFGRFPLIFVNTWRPFLAGFVMMIALYLMRDCNLFFLIFTGFILYMVILSLLGEFKEERYMPLRLKILQLIGKGTKQN